MNEERNKDFEIIKMQADLILIQKQLKQIIREHNAMTKIYIEQLKPICEAFYHEMEYEEDSRGVGYV